MGDPGFVEYIIGQLEPLSMSARPLFGGRGFYLDGQFFGFVADERLYFRTDEESRAEYLKRGMSAFHPSERPRGPRTVDRNYEVPPEVIEDGATLRAWAERAAAVR